MGMYTGDGRCIEDAEHHEALMASADWRCLNRPIARRTAHGSQQRRIREPLSVNAFSEEIEFSSRRFLQLHRYFPNGCPRRQTSTNHGS